MHVSRNHSSIKIIMQDSAVTDDVYSEGEDIDTSRCYCTDGRTFTRDNETDQAFEMNDIENQSIPYYNIIGGYFRRPKIHKK